MTVDLDSWHSLRALIGVAETAVDGIGSGAQLELRTMAAAELLDPLLMSGKLLLILLPHRGRGGVKVKGLSTI